MPDIVKFPDRRAAGRALAQALLHLRAANPLVLALPRGGVPVAFEVAVALGAELDLLLVRKLGAPGDEELGIGAVVDGADPQLVLNEETVRQLGLGDSYLHAELDRQLAELERRRRTYIGKHQPVSVAGRTVIVVDDGIATGGSMIAALDAIRRNKPASLVVAVPVAPPGTLASLRQRSDEVICLATPEPFYAVGAHYADFTQTSDDEVIALLGQQREDANG